MRSISSLPFTISLTCKYILIIVRYSYLLFSIRYGFTEKSSIFQTRNFGKGGKGNDMITVSVQDKAGMDISDFATPPDGQSGHMKMFLWDYTNVRPLPLLPSWRFTDRTGRRIRKFDSSPREHAQDYEQDDRGCDWEMFADGGSRGLGEWWSDAMAEWVPSPSLSSLADYVWRWTEWKNATVLDYVRIAVFLFFIFLGGGGDFYVGQVLNQTGGIRYYPYSTSLWVLRTAQNHPHSFNPWFIYLLSPSIF